jgi:hypothetical protein
MVYISGTRQTQMVAGPYTRCAAMLSWKAFTGPQIILPPIAMFGREVAKRPIHSSHPDRFAMQYNIHFGIPTETHHQIASGPHVISCFGGALQRSGIPTGPWRLPR